MLIGRMNEDIGHLRDAKRMFIFVYFGGNLMMFFIHFIWKNYQKKRVNAEVCTVWRTIINLEFVIQIFDASDVIIHIDIVEASA